MSDSDSAKEPDNEYIVYAIFLRHVADQIHKGMTEETAIEYVIRTEYADMDGAQMNVEFDRQRKLPYKQQGDLTCNVVLPLYLRYKTAATKADWSRSGENARKALERIKTEFARQLSMD
jgi:hypothetical protein